MRRPILSTALLLLAVGSATLQGQDVVLNGDFETGSYDPMWKLTGGNTWTFVLEFETVAGVPSLCLRRRPGYSHGNGGIEMDVHLFGDVEYSFKADIAINDHRISEQHAILKHKDGKYRLVDMGSSNGTLVNGTEIDSVELGDGDRVKVGRTTLVIKTFQDLAE